MVKARLLGAVGIVVVFGVPASGLTAQAPDGPTFEVASVRVAASGMGNVSPFGQNRWTAGCVPLATLLELAFDVAPFAVAPVVGLPSWSRTECFAVAAKAEDGVLLTREELRPRLKRLLEERFKLVAHIQIAEVNGYALVLGKGGPKLKETSNPSTMTAIGIGRMRAPSVSMEFFVKQLGTVIKQPVVNETGLIGNYDLTLTFAPDGATDSPLPSIFTALQEQLGLKLEARKTPVNTLVIDHVEHPTEN
jgi:uncharacterized protein (TIGR03435 family)